MPLVWDSRLKDASIKLSEDGAVATATDQCEVDWINSDPGAVANQEFTEGKHYIEFSGPAIEAAQGYIGVAGGVSSSTNFRMMGSITWQIELDVQGTKMKEALAQKNQHFVSKMYPGGLTNDEAIKLKTLAGKSIVMCIDFNDSGRAAISFSLDGEPLTDQPIFKDISGPLRPAIVVHKSPWGGQRLNLGMRIRSLGQYLGQVVITIQVLTEGAPDIPFSLACMSLNGEEKARFEASGDDTISLEYVASLVEVPLFQLSLVLPDGRTFTKGDEGTPIAEIFPVR